MFWAFSYKATLLFYLIKNKSKAKECFFLENEILHGHVKLVNNVSREKENRKKNELPSSNPTVQARAAAFLYL